MRYDPTREVYRDCRWCHGRGCLACPDEARAAYRREFPDGPLPFATFKIADLSRPEVKAALGADAIRKAFGPGGRGIEEVIENCDIATKAIQAGKR